MIIGQENSSFELDAERVKRHNSSPGKLDLIVHVTRELLIGLGSCNSVILHVIFKPDENTTHKIDKWTFFFFVFFFFQVVPN